MAFSRLDANAQAEADGGDDEAPPDEESDDGSRRFYSQRVLSPLLSGQLSRQARQLGAQVPLALAVRGPPQPQGALRG